MIRLTSSAPMHASMSRTFVKRTLWWRRNARDYRYAERRACVARHPDQVGDSAARGCDDLRVRDARRTQGARLDATASGAEPCRTLGTLATCSRRCKADSQGRPHPEDGRSADLSSRAVYL